MISSSGNVKSSLGPTLAALNTTTEIRPMFSTSLRTFSNAEVFLIFAAKVWTLTSLPAAFVAARTLSRSLERRAWSRDIKAIFENLWIANKEAIETPFMGPEPMSTSVCLEAIAVMEDVGLYLGSAVETSNSRLLNKSEMRKDSGNDCGCI